MLSTSTLSVYPNPANTVLSIVGQSEMVDASFYDVTGKLLMQVELNGVLTRNVDVSGFDKGLYILQVKDVTGKVNTVKFLKQ